MLKGKTVVVGVCGGIAAYKAVEVVSRLKKLGAGVHVIMTKAAVEFVTPLTFREISANPVVADMWDQPQQWNVAHIALATQADLMLIVPATANVIGKAAAGIADDMLLTTLMATQAPVLFAPAMNTNMYVNPIVQANISKLTAFGYQFIQPAIGRLACGTEGVGKLPEPAVIVEYATRLLTIQDFAGKRLLITAGGTIEPIDPVRYIGNRSSGKMGYALAKAAVRRGAFVTLVSGPVGLPEPIGVNVVRVETAAQMRQAVLDEFPNTDIVIKAAAVADYRPQQAAEQKIKKSGQAPPVIALEKTADILSELGAIKRDDQILVGFAAETQQIIAYAQEKIHKKNLDIIVANDVTLPGAGFNSDTNIVKLLDKHGGMEELPKLSKDDVAWHILNRIRKIS